MKRVALALLVLAVVAASLAGTIWRSDAAQGAEPRQKVKLVLQWEPQAQFAGYYAAREQGIYARHGLDVEIINGGPDVDSMQVLAAGEADFATAFLSGALSAYDQGVDLVNVCQVINRSSLLLIARRNSVETPQDLNGKRISIWGTSFQAAYLGWFETLGIKPKIIPQYYSVNLFLRSGVVACAAMEYNEYNTMYQSGIDADELTVFSMRATGFGFPEDGIYALASTMKERPELCRAFAEATMEGWEWCRAHEEKAIDIVMVEAWAHRVPANRPHQRWMLEHVLAAIFPSPSDFWQTAVLSRGAYERTVAVMTSEGQIAKAPTYWAMIAGGPTAP